jgi:MarR family transcriptional regulator, transcriptional regulator for hemolysin
MTLKREYDDETSIGRKIVLTSKTIQRAFDLELRNNVGVTMTQWRAINVLVTQNGITQKEIADKLDLDASSIIPLIDRLETKEFVKRKPDPDDRRVNRLYLTEKAESLLDSMHTCASSVRKILTKGISKDRLKIMQEGLKRINQNLISHYEMDSNDDNNSIVETNIDNNNPSSKRISSPLVRKSTKTN